MEMTVAKWAWERVGYWIGGRRDGSARGSENGLFALLVCVPRLYALNKRGNESE